MIYPLSNMMQRRVTMLHFRKGFTVPRFHGVFDLHDYGEALLAPYCNAAGDVFEAALAADVRRSGLRIHPVSWQLLQQLTIMAGRLPSCRWSCAGYLQNVLTAVWLSAPCLLG